MDIHPVGHLLVLVHAAESYDGFVVAEAVGLGLKDLVWNSHWFVSLQPGHIGPVDFVFGYRHFEMFALLLKRQKHFRFVAVMLQRPAGFAENADHSCHSNSDMHYVECRMYSMKKSRSQLKSRRLNEIEIGVKG